MRRPVQDRERMEGMEEKAAESFSPRLGWLEAYVATARHLSYEVASQEIGVNASNVQRSVERLEIWLHRVLVLGDVPLELPADDGMPPFLPIAASILEAFETCHGAQNPEPASISLRRSKKSMVRLIDLKTVMAVNRYTNFDAAAADLHCSYKTVRSRVSGVESALGRKIFKGRANLLTSAEGEYYARGRKDDRFTRKLSG